MGRFALVAIGVLAGAGCIQPQFQSCGDVICPSDALCVQPGVCATRDAVVACANLTDGAACTTSVFTGSCTGGVCLSARCGDGVVEGSEQCDGSVSGVDCVDYGFDLGVPTCSVNCGLDVVDSCTRFGWRRLFPEGVDGAWTDGTRFGFVSTDDSTVELVDGTNVQSTTDMGATFSGVTGNATEVVGYTEADIFVSDGGPFVQIDTSGLPNGVRVTWVASDNSLYAAAWGDAGDFCTIDRLASGGTTWSDIPTTTTSCEGSWLLDDQLYLAVNLGSTHELRQYTSSGWMTLATTGAQISALALDGSTVYVGTFGDGVYRVDGATQTSISDQYCDDVIVLPTGVYVVNSDGFLRITGNGPSEQFDAPIRGDAMTDGTNLYSVGNGVYVFTGMQYSDRSGVSGAITDFKLLYDGTPAAAAATALYWADDGTNWNDAGTDIDLLYIAGRSASDVYASDGESFVHFDGAFTDVAGPAAAPTFAALWATPSGSPVLYAVGPAGVGYALTSGGIWQLLAPPSGGTACDLAGIAGAGSEILAVGSCAGQGIVWTLSGSTFTESYRGGTPLVGLAFDAAGDVFAAGPNGGAQRIAGTWSAAPELVGTSVGATGPNDLWVAGGPGEVIHYDGTVWSRLGVVGAFEPHVIATERAIYIAGVSQSVLLR